MERNRGFFLHVLSYSWVLFLIGFGLLAWLHGQGLDKRLKENTSLAIELKPGLSQDSIEYFKKWLTSNSELIPSSVHQITRDDYQKLLLNELKEENFKLDQYLPEIFIFKLRQEILTKDRLKDFEVKVGNQNYIQKLSYQNELTDDYRKAMERIRIGFLAMTCMFVLVGFLISDYLAQVFVDARIPVIKAWSELGATDDKITGPYLKRVVYLGLASSFLSVCLIGLLLLLVYYLVPWLAQWLEFKKFFMVMGILIIIGPTLQYILVKKKIKTLIN